MGELASNLRSSDANALLRVAGLTVNYGSEGRAMAPALRGLGLKLVAGEIVGILGESGSGKSTLALSLLGLLPANCRVEGSIRYGEQELLSLDDAGWREVRGAGIAIIFQEPGLSLSPVLRVGDQIGEVIRAHRKTTRREREVEAKAILEQVQLKDVDRIAAAYPHQLSSGQLHRVAIAQALACRPKILIADEPTRALDPTIQNEVIDLLRDANRESGTAIIFITHNPALLAGFADRAIVMYAGQIVEAGPVSEVFSRPHHPYTQGLLQLSFRNRGFDSGRFSTIPGMLEDSLKVTQGCVFEPRCHARTPICRNETPTEMVAEPGRRVSCFNHVN